MNDVLNCSKYNERFHPSRAKIEIQGFWETIDYHCAMAKRILKEGQILAPASVEEANDYPSVGFVVNGYLLPFHYFQYYVGMMWYKYLSTNPELVESLKGYREFKDYGQYTDVSHAQFLHRYMETGAKQLKSGERETEAQPGELLLEWLKPLTQLLSQEDTVVIERSAAMTESINEVVGFFYQLNVEVEERQNDLYRSFCPVVYRGYRQAIKRDVASLVGGCFIKQNAQTTLQRLASRYQKNHRNERQYVAFLGLVTNDNRLAFRESVQTLKTFAQERCLAVSLPYDLGCQKVGSDEWNLRYSILKEIFSDYYVTLHQA